MKFISTETESGKHLEIASKLDTGLIKNVKLEEENLFSMQYEADEVGNPAGFPSRVSSMALYIKTTNSNIYVGAITEFTNDEDYARFESFTTDSGIEFDVILDDEEKIKLLTSLVNYFAA